MGDKSLRSFNTTFMGYYVDLLGIVLDSISDVAVLQHQRCGGRRDNTNEPSI